MIAFSYDPGLGHVSFSVSDPQSTLSNPDPTRSFFHLSMYFLLAQSQVYPSVTGETAGCILNMLLVYLKATKGERRWEPNIHVFALEPTVTRKSLHEWQKHANTEGS